MLCLLLASYARGQLALDTPQRLAGSRLMIEIQEGEAKVRYTANGFHQTRLKVGDLIVREIFATGFMAQASGERKATYSAVPVGYGNGWYEATEVRHVLNETLRTGGLRPEKIATPTLTSNEAGLALNYAQQAEQLNIAAARSPVIIRVLETGPSAGQYEILISPARARAQAEFSGDGSRLSLTRSVNDLKRGKEVVTTKLAPSEESLSGFEEIHIGGGKGEAKEVRHSALRPPALGFIDSETRKATVAGLKIEARGSATQRSLSNAVPATEGGFPDREIKITWDFKAGEPPDAGFLEAADADAGTWLPSYGSVRKFNFKLTNREGVEAVRFVLSGVSAHHGIAVNAGEAAVNPSIGRGARQEWPVELAEAEAKLSWNRYYAPPTPTAVDELPDLYFLPALNPNLVLEGAVQQSGLATPVGDHLSTTKLADTITAAVSVGDWGASGRLRAQVLMDGFWEDVKVQGPAAAEDGVTLLIPMDGNRDGIADAFQAAGPPIGSSEDTDGDGLRAFEEYRGVYTGGKHVRLDPRRRDVFLLDYAHQMAGKEAEFASLLSPSNLNVHFITPDEQRGEQIGAAMILVLEDVRENALPAVLSILPSRQAKAWKALRPRPENRTLFDDGSGNLRLLAADLTRTLDLPAPVQTAQTQEEGPAQ